MGFKYRVITEREDKLTRQALRRVPGVISVEGTIKEDGLFAYDVTANIPDGDSHSTLQRYILQCQRDNQAVLEFRPLYSEFRRALLMLYLINIEEANR